MPLSHLKSVCTLCPTGQQNFCHQEPKRTDHRPTEREIVHVIVAQVVRTVVRAVVRAIVSRAVVVVEHPRSRQKRLRTNWIHGDATYSHGFPRGNLN